MPYGLTLMLEAFSTAIHGGDPLDVWQIDEHLNWLKQQAQNPAWVQGLIKEHLLDNPHRVRLTLTPDNTKAQRLIDQEQDRLAKLDSTLSDDDKAKIKAHTARLEERQAMVDDVSVLPKVGLEDVPSGVAFTHAIKQQIIAGGQTYPVHLYHSGTNGLYYYQLVTPLVGEAADRVLNDPLLPLYLTLVSEVGTKNYDARKFQAVQAAKSSGITARISQRTDLHDANQMSSYFVVATRALTSRPEAIGLIGETINHTIFGEIDRIRELLQQKQSSWQSRLTGAGHAYAMQTAARNFSRLAKTEYAYSGLPALASLKAFLNQANQDASLWQVLSERLSALHSTLVNLPKQVILVCEQHASQSLLAQIADELNFANDTPSITEKPLAFDALNEIFDDNAQNDTAWLISTNVYHNAAAYAATTSAHDDTPALMVLAPFLRNGYLHSAIREKGGAYGGGASFDSNAAAFKFYSYRDPNCAETFAHFEKSVDWLLDNDHDQEQLHEAILGIIAGMDKPGSPAGEAVKSCFSELHERGQAWQQQMRAKILAVSIDDLKRVAVKYLKNQPCVKATLAPLEKETEVQSLGFTIKKLG